PRHGFVLRNTLNGYRMPSSACKILRAVDLSRENFSPFGSSLNFPACRETSSASLFSWERRTLGAA
ncbi:MAG TPA: hypothetical protein PLY30_02760, partial [Candidatus Omnitrophota bacterium]|nr:hypothetical protein [Candidatus Omnitrophota bacterium]